MVEAGFYSGSEEKGKGVKGAGLSVIVRIDRVVPVVQGERCPGRAVA